MTTARYTGRFAPSPTGPLHAGSLATALASWLDARAHGGRWLVRIEDLDGPRCIAGADDAILQALTAVGLTPDATPVWQSRRTGLYQRALDGLLAAGHVYGCACSRKEIADSLTDARTRHQTLAYPGTCRPERGGLGDRPPRAWRVRVPDREIVFTDRWQGRCSQNLGAEVGDFVLRRADGEWAYQLAVVVDDAEQQMTDVVRGADLLDSTPRQIWLQQLLALPTPRYLHLPVVAGDDGQKLSKQNGAQALDVTQPLELLRAAGAHLGLPENTARTVGDWLAGAVGAWRDRHG